MIETSAPALFVGHKPAEVDDPFALEGWLAFSFPFADAVGELMTHEGCTFETHSASVSRVSQPRVRFAATPPPVKNKQHRKRSKSDMIFGANNVEWLSWFETPRSPGGLRTGIAPPRTARPWPKRDSLRRRPSLAVEFAFWCESNRQQLTSPASYQYESWHRKCRRNPPAIVVFFLTIFR